MQLGEGVDLVLKVAVELGLERGDAGPAVEAETLLDHGRRAEQVRLEADVEGHPLGRLLPPAGQPQVLHGGDVVGEALAGEGGVVEVRVLGCPWRRS